MMRPSRVRSLLLPTLAAAMLAACATTPSGKLAAVYCVNAPGAGQPPASVPGAYCVNIGDNAVAPRTTPTASAPPAAAPAASAAAATTAVATAASPQPATVAPSKPGPSGEQAYQPPHGALTLAPSVDVDRYMGKWYVIGFIPYAFENGQVGAYYDFKKDGDKIDFSFHGRWHDFDHDYKAREGEAYVVKHTNGAKWRVTYTWPIYSTFPILYVDNDYSVSLVGYPGRTLGWVLSRSPNMDNATYQALLARFAQQGYDVSQFHRVAQSPEQLDRAVN